MAAKLLAYLPSDHTSFKIGACCGCQQLVPLFNYEESNEWLTIDHTFVGLPCTGSKQSPQAILETTP